jgi:predicted aldo/keto reductase-like oxidoreductase
MSDGTGMDRREFVRRTTLGTVGAGLVGAGIGRSVLERAQAQDAPAIPKRVLGRTELEVSEISFGSFGFQNSDLLSSAIDAGVNLIDTSPDYQEGAAERAIGQVMAKRREGIVLMTKWRVSAATTKQQLLDGLAGSLERLQTDHVDIIHVGLVESVEQLQNPAIFEAFDEAKAAKKVRFLGVSTHSGKRREICEQAINDGRFDMMCVKHNFGEADLLTDALGLGKERNLGVVVFKVKAGTKPEDVAAFAPGKSFDLAAAKWALQNPAVHSVNVGISSYEDIKLYASARGLPLDDEERRGLEALAGKFAASYCRYCGSCEGACPGRVAIADIMRYRMYAESYGMVGEAKRLYARLPRGATAAACVGCEGLCRGGCPNGFDTRQRLQTAHRMLA